LYHFGARYYNPVLGRFITRDTVFGDLSNPQSLNPYVYCVNNPLRYLDPNGKQAIPTEDYNQLYQLISTYLPPDQATILIALLIARAAQPEIERRIKAEFTGRKDAFFYDSASNWKDPEGSSTHYNIGYQASYATSPMGPLSGGMEKAYKRKLQQQAFLQGKPGITEMPPDYTFNEFVMDTTAGLIKINGDDPVVVSLTLGHHAVVDYITKAIRDRWSQTQVMTNQIELNVPPTYIDAPFR